ncbi:MAG TPA: PEP-CTERM sorting domain-containing protein [Gammaproteobacteria bacterium]|nr:PEP-CTERM sorting domain-containing protein [Gammaproteobacteria bacterium]
MRTKEILVSLWLCLALGSTVTQAAPILWNISGMTFDDGGTATGSFIFDANTTTYSAVSIVTTAGTNFAGASYDTGDVSNSLFGGSDENGLHLVRNLGESILLMDFDSALTNAGGVISLSTGFPAFEGDCADPTCGSGDIFRAVAGGGVIGATVPEPTTLILMGLGLAGIGYRRKQIKAA